MNDGLSTEWLDEAFAGPAWHGPSLLSALRGVDAALASWRPRRGRHNIWEVVVHAAFWKHVVRGRLCRTPIERFPYAGRNWFVRPGGSRRGAERTWADDVRLLREEHGQLRAVVAGLSPRDGTRVLANGQTAAEHIRGIAAHDVYHAGQIRLIRALGDYSR